MTGDGPYATTIQLALKPFTLVGATTRTGLLTAPLLSRFGYVVRLDFYPVEDLEQHRAAQRAPARRARSTPAERARSRRARGARRASPTASSAASATSPRCSATARSRGRSREDTAERLEIDAAGLDEMDRRLLHVIIDHYDGGPVGIDTLAAALSEPRDTIEDVYEPFLLQQGFLGRTPRGPGRHPPRLRAPRASRLRRRSREIFS